MTAHLIRRATAGYLLGCLIIFSAVLEVVAEEPPLLQINTEMHNDAINRIAVNNSGTILATAGVDKSAKLWDLSSGTLLRTIRVPSQPGYVGSVYAVALTPGGDTLAVGGFTGPKAGQMALYLYDVGTGELQQTIENLPNVIYHLAFSPDGQYLLAAHSRGGVTLFARQGDSWAVQARLQPKSGKCYWVDWHPDASSGRFVTASLDGFVRLYELDGSGAREVRQARPPVGKLPYAAVYSPDGQYLAVMGEESTSLAVVHSATLETAWQVTTAGIPRDSEGLENGELSCVAWGREPVDPGKLPRLYAGTTYDDGRTCPLYLWDDGGRGRRYSLAQAAETTIMQVAALNDGRVVLAAADPKWEVLSANGKPEQQRVAEKSNFARAYNGTFEVSEDGAAIRFGMKFDGEKPVLWSVADRALVTAEAVPDGTPQLFPVRLEPNNGPFVKDWIESRNPKIDGKPIKLDRFETSNALAYAPDGQQFVLGADFTLRGYDGTGQQRWRVPVESAAEAVTYSGDGKLIIAGHSDGTLRWYRAQDGQHLLSLFAHGDGKRWIAWTPSGYYMASPGAEDMVGWLVNRGQSEAPLFYPASRLRSTYHHPDVVEAILRLHDEGAALREVNLSSKDNQPGRTDSPSRDSFPPKVSITAPAEGVSYSGETISVSYRIELPDGGEPATKLEALINGRPVPSGGRTSTVMADPEDAGTLEIPMPGESCIVSLVASNRHGAGPSASVRLTYQRDASQPDSEPDDPNKPDDGSGTSNGGDFTIKPKLYILAVGVSDYDNADLKLNFAAKDAEDFATAMSSQGDLYRDVVVRRVTNKDASREGVHQALNWLRGEVTSKDVAMVMMSGHGVNDADGSFYYLPRDAKLDDLVTTAVPYQTIKRVITALPGKVLYFVDTCHAGNIFGAKTRSVGSDISGMINELASAENGIVVFASSTGRQFSFEKQSWGNGAFTKAVVEGIDGKADFTKDGSITINELDLYISERVKELTGNKQTPTTTKPETIPDFPIAKAGRG